SNSCAAAVPPGVSTAPDCTSAAECGSIACIPSIASCLAGLSPPTGNAPADTRPRGAYPPVGLGSAVARDAAPTLAPARHSVRRPGTRRVEEEPQHARGP